MSGWTSLLWRNRFAVGLRQLPFGVIPTVLSPLTSLLGSIQRIFYGARIARTQLEPGPLFVVGHWRSGTTLVHELLARDPRHTFPNVYECILPSHFVLSEGWLKCFVKWLAPDERPMDAMAIGVDSPQEDEFALCNLGLRSPYCWIAFPNGVYDQEWETLQDLRPADRDLWKSTLWTFLQGVTTQRPGRLVLKNPLHSFRIPVLRELFPDARFLHVVRHPAAVLRSTLRLWPAMQRCHGYQTACHDQLEEHVLATGERMFRALLAARESVPTNRLCEVRYEDIIAHPETTLRRIYDSLELGDFDPALPGVHKYLEEVRGHQTRTKVSPDDLGVVRKRWAFYYEHYGYDLESLEQNDGL
jgi:hypothetical protein